VNLSGDAADLNVGDGVCDTNAGTAGEQCTLRAAVQEANASGTDDTITFAASLNGGVISLSTALPDITGNLNVTGPGPGSLTVQRSTAPATPRFRILTVTGSAITLSLSGLTLSNGHTADGSASGNGEHGGAILVSFGNTLTLMNVAISGNSTGDGGTNALGGYGGGIFSNGNVTLQNCTINGNRTGNAAGSNGVGGAGGGIFSIGTLIVTSSTINDNLTGTGPLGSGNGGGIFANVTIIVANSTISNNKTGTTQAGGGGIWAGNTVTLSNSTISGNEANWYGGGLALSGSATLTNLTITNNRAGNLHGAGLFPESGSDVILRNTIVAGNFLGPSPSTTPDQIAGTVNSTSACNLIGDGGGGGLQNAVNGNIFASDPGLAPLANNGGPTLTHALLPQSYAIEAGNNSFVTNPPFTGFAPFTDQRGPGFKRILDAADVNEIEQTVDIGALEGNPMIMTIPNQTFAEDFSPLGAFMGYAIGDDSEGFSSIVATSSNQALLKESNLDANVPNNPGSRSLFFKIEPDQFGTTTVTITLTSNNGQSISWPFLMTINSVNDPPTFTKGADQVVNPSPNNHSVTNWATNISAGAPNESGQTLTFQVTGNTNTALFSVQPAINSSGTLTYTCVPNATGTAAITVNLKDNGGTSPGVDTSAAQTFNITVTPPPVSAQVNTLGDAADLNVGDRVCDTDPASGNQCTLRAAIEETNASGAASGNSISFLLPPPSTITLSNALPDINANTTINGPGASLLTVQRSSAGGTPNFRIFTINAGKTVGISGLTVSNGNVPGAFVPANAGGGILNSGALTLNNSVVSGNNSGFGGGLANRGTATINQSSIANNTSAGSCGGIANGSGDSPSSVLTVTGTTISNNISQGFGGGLVGGGGLCNIGQATVTNSTVSSNSAANGGGIFNLNLITLGNVTVSGNNASSLGGGLYNPDGALNPGIGTTNFGNTIVAGNTAPTGPDCDGINFNSLDYNLIGNTSGGNFTGTTTHNLTNVAALLGPLQNNGGSTKTHALLVGSPAMDAGNSSLTTDQRGQARPIDDQTVTNAAGGNATDIGANESHNLQVNSIGDLDDGACTSLATGNGCTLREAINAANLLFGTQAIVFAPALTTGGPAAITLSSALPALSSDVSIAGSGANLLTIQRSSVVGTPDFRIFTISSGTTVFISGLTITNGNAVGAQSASTGGGILNAAGTLVINNCVITANNAISGGGIYNGAGNTGGTLTINNSTVSSNTGGGLNNTLINGGINTLTINNSTISGNSSSAGSCGAALQNTVGTNSTAIATINNSTISGNTSTGSFGVGGILNGTFLGGNATLTLNNSTVYANNIKETIGTGGIANVNSSCNSCTPTVKLTNSIVAGNLRFGSTPNDFSGGADSSSSFNLIGNGGSAGLTNGVNGNQVGVSNPGLGSLANNGGPTMTNALLPGSPAINAGSNANLPADDLDLDGDGNRTEPIPFDQRGLARIVNTTVDIGAFESRGFIITATSGTPQAATILTLFSSPLVATVSSAFGEPVAGGIVTFVAPVSGASGTFPGSVITANATTNASGVATAPAFTANGTAGGPYNVVASPGGSPSANFSLTNAKANQTITVNTHAPGNATYNTSFTVAATSSSGLVVSYSATGACTNNGATFTMTSGTAPCTVIYDQGGNSNYNPATVTESVTAQKAATTTAVTSSVNPSNFGQTVTFTATVSSSAGTPSGTVQFKSDGASVGSPVSLVNGVAQLTTSSLSAGTHTITADYAGDANFLAGSGTLTGSQAITPALSINDVSITEGDSGTVSASFTVTLSAPSNQTVTVNFATADGTGHFFVPPPPSPGTPPPGGDYFSNVGSVTFAPTETTKSINVAIIGDMAFEPNETFFVNLSAATNATISDAQGMGTILNDDAAGGSFAFSSPTYTVTEIAGSILVIVKRNGDTTQAVTVDYATSDITADGRKDYVSTRGTLRFDVGEFGKAFPILVNVDAFAEASESLQLTLSNPTGGAVLGGPATATLQIDNTPWNGPPANSIDDAQRFVRQHYHDFLNREASNDPGGLAFWTNQITECQQPGATCDAEVRRVNVSAAFFLSIEFQETGYLVERLYKTAYGDASGLSNFGPSHTLPVPVIRFDEFLPDTQAIGQGVVVGQGNWQTVLENNKQAFIAEFVQRAPFLAALPSNLTAAQFVDQLNANAGNPLSPDERNTLVNSGMTRAQMLRAVAEHRNLISAESNRAFVLIQYFGYLRRNPNDAPDSDYSGYDFWLSKLNEFNGNFINAEMVKAFINSGEYRGRFGP
jgi:CSLREA domain-containing protein